MKGFAGITLAALLYGCAQPQVTSEVEADFNNDGRNDLLQVIYKTHAEPHTKRFAGSFDAYLANEHVMHFELQPLGLKTIDYDNNGIPDLSFIAWDDSSPRRTDGMLMGSYDQYVAIGKGDGTFQSPRLVHHYKIKPQL